MFTYKRKKANGGARKTGRGAMLTGKWRHEEQMSRILCDDPSVSPKAVRTSLLPSEDGGGTAGDEDRENIPVTEGAKSSMPPPPSTPTASSRQPLVFSPTTPTGGDTGPAGVKRKRRQEPTADIAAYLERREQREIEFFQKTEREEERLKLEVQRIALLRDLVNMRRQKNGESQE